MKVEKYGQYKSKCIIETSFKSKGVGKNGLTMEKLKELMSENSKWIYVHYTLLPRLCYDKIYENSIQEWNRGIKVLPWHKGTV